jgi:hypothetical protein
MMDDDGVNLCSTKRAKSKKVPVTGTRDLRAR